MEKPLGFRKKGRLNETQGRNINVTGPINCKYCYMYNVGNELYKSMPPSSPVEVMESLAVFIIDVFRSVEPSSVDLILHGGEPMLMPPHQFDLRMELLFRILRSSLKPDELDRFELRMQTNAILVKDAWLDQIKKWKINVGVSLDGPKDIHDLMRVDKKNFGTHSQVIDGVEKLRQLEQSGDAKQIGALCVINPNVSGRDVYTHLYHEQKFRSISFLLPFMNWNNYSADDVIGVKRFLTEAFEAWLDDVAKNDFPHVRIFQSAFAEVLKLGRNRSWGGAVSLGYYIVIVESDGTIMPEESLRPAYSGRYADLTVHDTRISQILEDERFFRLVDMDFSLPEECAACDLSTACRGGQAFGRIGMRLSGDFDFSRKSVYCDVFAELLALAAYYMNKRGTDLLASADIGNRQPMFEA